MTEITFKSLQNEHEKLLQKQQQITKDNQQEFIKNVKDYIERTKSAGGNIPSTRERDQVRANLRYWANYVYGVEKVFPDTELAPSTVESRTMTGPLIALLLFIILIGTGFYFFGRSMGSTGASAETEMVNIIGTETPTYESTITDEPAGTESHVDLSTPSISGFNLTLSNPAYNDTISPDLKFIGSYDNLQPGWYVHVLFIKGDKYYPVKNYYPVPAQSRDNTWSIKTRLEESPEEMAQAQSYSIILAISLDDSSRDLLVNASESGIDFKSLPSTVITFPNSTAVLLRKDGYVAVQGTRLVYPAFSGESWDLYTSNPDGTGVIQITHTEDIDERWPKLSPDGTKLVYVQIVRGTSEQSIHVMDSNGNQEIINSGRYALEDPRWSPDSSYISYALGDTSRSPNTAYWSIHKFNLSSGDDEVISGDPAPLNLNRHHAWLPDSKSIIFNATTRNSTTSGFIKIPIDDPGNESLFFDSEIDDVEPYIAELENGYLLAYASIDFGSYEHNVFAVILDANRDDPSDGIPVRLTKTTGGADFPIPAPDLKSIYYVREGVIFRVDISFDGNTIVTNGTDGEFVVDTLSHTSSFNPSFDINFMDMYIPIVNP